MSFENWNKFVEDFKRQQAQETQGKHGNRKQGSGRAVGSATGGAKNVKHRKGTEHGRGRKRVTPGI